MIKTLVYKEFRLNITPWMYFCLLFPLLLFIPAWVFFIALGYIFMFFMFVSQNDKMNQDLGFASSLPVPKSQIVLARTAMVVIVQFAFLLVAALVAVAHFWLYDSDNSIGMNPNLAFFGLSLVMYAVFNLIYLPGSYSRPYRMLWPILGGVLAALIVGGTLTTLPAFLPALAVINDRGLGHFGHQLAVFAVSLLLYAGVIVLAYRRAAANFAKVDL